MRFLLCSFTGIVFADLISLSDDSSTPTAAADALSRGRLVVRANFPQYPSAYHVVPIDERSCVRLNRLQPHTFFAFQASFSCEQLCFAAHDSLAINEDLLQMSRAISVSLAFSPCADLPPFPGASLSGCQDYGSAVESPHLVVGISSDLMSLANLTLEHVVGLQGPVSADSNNASASSSNSNGDGSTPPPLTPAVAFTHHHCTQLQHALTSGHFVACSMRPHLVISSLAPTGYQVMPSGHPSWAMESFLRAQRRVCKFENLCWAGNRFVYYRNPAVAK
jgi:hypothetical protein